MASEGHGSTTWDDRSDEIIDRLRAHPGDKVNLARRDTNESFGLGKDEAVFELARIRLELDLLQQRLYAEQRRSVLLVIQAMDAAGKDGTIRNVLSGLNPQGIPVTSFKAPGGPEAQHDYLWRVHHACPSKGQLAVFNRSHYEDVLVVRVKGLVDEAVWRRRYEHIRHFEQLLTDEGTTVVKVFLHVSKEEQAARLQERLDDPEKRWKFRLGDLDDRALWPHYQQAYEEAIERTTTDGAPWFVVPADSNSRRNLAVATIVRSTLRRLDPQVPEPDAGLAGVKVV